MQDMIKEVLERSAEGSRNAFIPSEIRACECARGFRRGGGHHEDALPLEVRYSGHDEAVLESLRRSCEMVNEAAGRRLLILGGRSRKKARTAIVTLKMGGKAHGETSMSWDRDRRIEGGAIRMLLRPKRDKSQEQQRREYTSTLSHELLHALGLTHVETEKNEIMSVGRGGTCICQRCPVEAPMRWNRSPKTLKVLLWLYGAESRKVAEKVDGFATYCTHCFELGFVWN